MKARKAKLPEVNKDPAPPLLFGPFSKSFPDLSPRRRETLNRLEKVRQEVKKRLRSNPWH